MRPWSDVLWLVALQLAFLLIPLPCEEDVPSAGWATLDDSNIVTVEGLWEDAGASATAFRSLSGGQTTGASGGSASSHHDYANALYYMIVACTWGMLSYWVLDIFHIGLPYTVAVFVEGMILGALHFNFNLFTANDGPFEFLDGHIITNFGKSINTWANIDSHLLLYVFLPVLLFGDSMSLNWEVLKGCAPQCLFLAGPGVAIGSAASAIVAKYVMPYNWDWETAATFGSILAATDPVAVVGILKELGCSKVLTMQIAGESLLNDGTAIVFFNVFKDMMTTGEKDVKKIVITFTTMPFGATLLGITIGILCCFFTAWCSDRFQHSSDILQLATPLLAAFWAFFFGEHELKVSGVLACVFAAFTMTRVIWPIVLDEHGMHAFWHMAEFLANTLIFFLSGTLTAKSVNQYIEMKDVGYLALLYVLVIVIRFFMMFLFMPILSRIGMGTNWKDICVISWGGLRGAVGLALALQVNADFPNATGARFVFHIAGVACLTLLVNATTCKKLVEALGMSRRNWAKESLLRHLSQSQRRQTLTAYKALAATSRFKQHHHGLIKQWVSALQVEEEEEGGRHNGPPTHVTDGSKSHKTGHSGDTMRHSMARIKAETTTSGGTLDQAIPLASLEKVEAEVQTLRQFLTPKDDIDVQASLRTQRELYYSIVRSSYSDMTKSGMLPSHSRAVLRLQNSVDFGECRSHDPLCDLAKLTGLISVGQQWTSCAGFVRCIWAWREGYAINTDMVPIHRKNVVFDLFDIITFIDAHQAAERQIARLKIKHEKDRLLYISMQQVVLESRAQCHRAREFLQINNISAGSIALVRTLQLSLHLLYGEEHRIIELLNIGAVSEQDMHELKHEVHHDSASLFKNCLKMQSQEEDNSNYNAELLFPTELHQAHAFIKKEGALAVGGQRMSMYDGLNHRGETDSADSVEREKQALVHASPSGKKKGPKVGSHKKVPLRYAERADGFDDPHFIGKRRVDSGETE